MRKIYAGFFLFCFFSFIVSAASAKSDNESDLNIRLKNLQQRLLSFHAQTAQKFVPLTNLRIEEGVTQVIEVNDELFDDLSEIEELDANKGAALTILFHDWEFFENEKRSEFNQNEITSENKVNSNEIKEADNVGNFFNIKYKIAKMPTSKPTNSRILKLEELKKRIVMSCSR